MQPKSSDFVELAVALGVVGGKPFQRPADVFDLMLVGDGSGTTADLPAAWCVFSYSPYDDEIKRYSGIVSHGTNNYAELAPYVHAVWKLRLCDIEKQHRILIVSDSELTIKQGAGEYARKANLSLWAAVDQAEKNGHKFIWKHVLRNSNPISKECDVVAKKLRKVMVDFENGLSSSV